MADEKQQELIPETKVPETVAEKPAEKSQADKLYADQGKVAEVAKPADDKPAVEALKPEDGKTSQADPKSVVPEKYQFKLPEGFNLGDPFLEKIAAESKQQGFSQEEAQKRLDDKYKDVSEHVRSLTDAFQREKDSWASQVEKDPEMGGVKFEETKALAMKAFKAFGSEKLMSDLNETGYGNYPELVRWAARVGKAISEDKIVTGEKVQTKRSAAQILYGGSSSKNH